MSISGDDEDGMTEDIRAAYEVFLQEQEDQQRNNRASWFSVTKWTLFFQTYTKLLEH